MTDRNGTFVWFELRTEDSKKSLAFYTEVLGWKTQVMEMGPEKYTMFCAGEVPVGGIGRAEGKAASFISYLHVPDVDAAAERVKKAGGTVIGAPYEIPTVGRMVEVKDQDGAAFFLFKGAEAGDPPPQIAGTFHWNELWTKDEKRALSFLTSVVGYSVQPMPMPGMSYNVLATKNGPAAGVMKAPSANLATGWVPYVRVDDCDRTVARAKKLGAKLDGEIGRMEEVGRFAVLVAPDGARFGVITPAAAK